MAATFVGLMSLPALAVLYASLVQKKWAVNVMAMMFAGFSIVLVVWFLYEYKMGFGANSWGGGVKDGVQTQFGTGKGLSYFFHNFWGKPGPITSPQGEQGQAVSAANTAIPFHFPTSTLAYFQFVFAAITPLLFMGSVLGRIKFSAWCLLVPLWSTFVYSVDAFLLWGGGYFAQEGALDFSGGYVIHMSAGVSGFVAAWVLGPRLLRDRQHAIPNNLVMAGVGAGILWLGWNGFNGGDPYYAGADAAAAVVNTNLATATGVIVWIAMDAWLSKEKKPTFLGGVNGMICGLVGHHARAQAGSTARAPSTSALICTVVVWFAWNYLSKVRPVLEGGRRPGRHLHPRDGRTPRRTPPRHLRRPGHGRVPMRYRPRPGDLRTAVDGLRALQRERAGLHRLGPPVVGTVPSGGVGDHLVGPRHLHPHEADRSGAARCPLQRRGPRGRRPGHPRRGGLPGRDPRRAGGRHVHGRRGAAPSEVARTTEEEPA